MPINFLKDQRGNGRRFAPSPGMAMFLQWAEKQSTRELSEEYLAWRREPRVDPAAGPEAHALEPTAFQERRLYGWYEMLHFRRDMPGIGIPGDEDY